MAERLRPEVTAWYKCPGKPSCARVVKRDSPSFVWAIDEDGRPTKCTAKPENRGKGSCKHKFHQNNTQSAHSFFAEHNIKIDDIVFDETEEIVEKKSIFKEDMVELSPYRMTDEEKSGLKQILTKKDLREDLETGGYIHFDEPLWNDMDKNYFCKRSNKK